MDVNELLDLVRARHSLRSEGALAEALGVPQNQLRHLRTQRRVAADVDLAWEIADRLGKPPAEVIAVLGFANEADPLKRERWRRRLVTLGVFAEG
jgi:hypothetical protein